MVGNSKLYEEELREQEKIASVIVVVKKRARTRLSAAAAPAEEAETARTWMQRQNREETE